MMSKVLLIACAQVLLIQCIAAQFIGSCNRCAATPCGTLGPYASPCGNGIGYSQIGGLYGIGASSAAGLAASNGGGLPTSSASPLAPNGVSLVSENVYEGALEVLGAVPFLGTVALEGALPTAGAGAVAYGCGNGEVGILSEDISGYGFGGLGYGDGVLGYGGLGYGAGVLGYGDGVLGYGAGSLGYGAGVLGCGAGSLVNGYNGLANYGGRASCGCNGLY
ncbi:unnamed protein product, partial [Brenthis ino]